MERDERSLMAEPASFNFEFNGTPVPARSGQTVAAALLAAGIRNFRKTDSGHDRGVFCGMGICQDCLVEIEGRSNRRACLSQAKAGLSVRTQQARPGACGDRNEMPSVPPTRSESPDILVIGAGPGGLAAAEAAASLGADVLLLDERKFPGGQFYKQTAPGLNREALDRQQRSGAKAIAAALDAGARMIGDAAVWGVFDGPVFCVETSGEALTVLPSATIVATGAYERPRVVPGWELAGVMTTGAAQSFWRTYRSLPGRKLAFAGNGPLNFQVALEISRAGAEVALVAEAAASPFARLPCASAMLASDPLLTLKGFSMVAELAARRIPVRYGTVIQGIEASGDQLAAHFARKSGRVETIQVDALCMNYGFHPQNEILRLLNVKFDYDSTLRQLVPKRDARFGTSVEGVFAVGDCCGTMGAPASIEEGRIAGIAAASLVRGCPATKIRSRRLARNRRFQRSLWRLFAAEPQDFKDISESALVCRCEEIDKSRIDKLISNGIFDMGAVKRATRMGMGRCQGRYCAQIVAPHAARAASRNIDEYASFAPRVPIKPVAISMIAATKLADGEQKMANTNTSMGDESFRP